MAGEFAHLHLHTSYSLLDGAIRPAKLFPHVLAQGMKAVAITDHGNMFGALDFYQSARAAGVKPIIGCEFYVANDRRDRTTRCNYHLVLLAKNEVGYRNLIYLNSMGFLEGFYYHPRIDKELLRGHSSGLIGTSACLGSETAQAVLGGGASKGREVAKEYASCFEPGAFYLEVMDNGLEDQQKVNEVYRQLSKETGIPLVATNDCHYIERDDYQAHEILLCIQQKRTLDDEKRLHHQTDAYYVKSPAEMEASFAADFPGALENAASIAASCNLELELGKNFLPRYEVPAGHDLDSYVDEVARAGLSRRLAERAQRGESFDAGEYEQRLVFELDVIKKMGFSGYFLIVWDFINWAKSQGIPVGPGRGS
ncbi:MAG: PHP domain-containing protein, partial [Pseudomonadota bacterium]